MANPPFNVDKVDKKKDFVKKDKRLAFGIPKNDNANYMWIQYFLSYLNKEGKAGFIMAASATDAASSEKEIRKKIIDTGYIEAIVSIPNNFFYTRSLPCHVWFFNKKKKEKNSILFIDAKNTFRKLSQTLNDFNQDQMEGLTTILKSYRGEKLNFFKNNWLKENFKKGIYEDITGLCKIVHIKEIIENDYSLNPGRYVGYEIKLDKNFNYKKEINQINDEVKKLNEENKKLIDEILKIKI